LAIISTPSKINNQSDNIQTTYKLTNQLKRTSFNVHSRLDYDSIVPCGKSEIEIKMSSQK